MRMSEIVPGKQEACSDQQWTPGQPSFPVRAAPQNFTLQAKIEQSRGENRFGEIQHRGNSYAQDRWRTETNSEWQPRAVPCQTTSKYQTQMQISWLPPFPRPHDKVPLTEQSSASGSRHGTGNLYLLYFSRPHRVFGRIRQPIVLQECA
jgi:hypothetical protein